jgi:4-hydroxythreonine-4-phosphate dehydrogenase
VELRETGADPGVRPTADASGRAQLAALDAALDAVLGAEADALCTAPITKSSVRAAGFRFPGHTEYLAHRTGTGRFAMMLAGPDLRVVPLTGHLPLSQVPGTLTPGLVADGAVVTARALVEDFGISRPRLALAGLNPHAGESGMLGQEEQQVLAPGLKAARRELESLGLDVELSGPLPADSLFVPPCTHDAVLCCYHDQALIPLKLLYRNQAVNVTLGLPIVRTSPAHGTAPDIAGQGRADPRSMRAALELALQLVRRRAG